MKIFRLYGVKRFVSGILIYAILHLMDGCYYYKVTRPETPPEPTLLQLQTKNKYIILHAGDQVWHLTNIVADENAVKGEISFLTGHKMYKTTNPTTINRYRKKRVESHDQSEVIHEVHIYVNEYSKIDDKTVSIPVKAVSKIEIYDQDKGATIASWTFSIFGLAMGALGIILIIAILTKSSCPFVYVYNGTNYIFTGEIFSGATQPGLERNDYLHLPPFEEPQKEYKLKITNEVREIQHTNLAELICIDHPERISVLTDKYGKPHSFNNAVGPVEACNVEGKNILSLINRKDTINYSGDEKMAEDKFNEEIVMKFLKPGEVDSAKLIIRAKNSFWLDILFTKFHALFGDRYNEFSKKQELIPGNELREWLTKQNIPLSLYLEKNGKWEFVDYFNIAGPMAFKDDILAFSLSGIESDTVKVKLDYGFMFWEIDYAGMDFSANEPVKITTVALKTASDENGTDILNHLTSADQDYYIQDKVGNEAFLTFPDPPVSGQQRDVFLHTKGYYKILRDQQGKTDRKLLKTFRKPGRFPEYSREMYKMYKAKMN
jgi:hypothetical protein